MNPIPPSNDDHAWRQMLEYLDGTLPPEEVRTLNERFKQDAELRSVFVDVLGQEIKLKELGEEAALAAEDAAESSNPAANIVRLTGLPQQQAVSRSATAPRPAPRRRWPRLRPSPVRSGLAMAASVALAGLAIWLWVQPTNLARLNSLEGELTIQRGDRKFAATTGEVLKAGDRLVTSPNSQATFRYLGEETEVSLEAVTQLKLDLIQGSKLLGLDQGTFEAAVAKQKPGKPLRLVTQQADAVVVGTRFKLLTSGTATRLEVFEGAVSILQGFEGPSLLVPAGKGVTVVPGQPALLQNLAESRGTILLEHWDGAAGGTNQTYLGQFMFSGVGVKPGSSRARGYLHPPRSGAYSFHVAGTGTTELWLSDSEEPARSRKVWSSADPSATPAVAQLRTDQRYYLELRCVSESEPAAFTLSWTTPGGQQRVIYGDYLSPFDPGAATPR
jgi:ferric-dicitrate binding protein FerR (iron transport regulator)